jgi:hypothetical protein
MVRLPPDMMDEETNTMVRNQHLPSLHDVLSEVLFKTELFQVTANNF